MIDNLRGMAIFALVAEAGSFSAVSRQLGLSASVISHHVSALERQLNTPLIYRTTRKLSLTQAGMRLARSAREMLDAAELGFQEIGQDGGDLSGQLRITAPAILQYARFLIRLSTFKKTHMKVELALKFTDQQLNIVEEGIDLAFRVGRLKDSSLMSRKMASGQEYLCAAPEYLENVGEINHPNDLHKLEMIEIAGVSVRTTLTHVETGRRSEIQPSTSIHVDSGFAGRRMAEEGCGMIKLPDFFLKENIEAGTLVIVLPEWQLDAYGIYAVWPPNAGQNRVRSQLLDFVAEIAKKGDELDRS